MRIQLSVTIDKLIQVPLGFSVCFFSDILIEFHLKFKQLYLSNIG